MSTSRLAPGFKVMHIDNIDYYTHCKTLTGCLSEIKEWYVFHVHTHLLWCQGKPVLVRASYSMSFPHLISTLDISGAGQTVIPHTCRYYSVWR